MAYNNEELAIIKEDLIRIKANLENRSKPAASNIEETKEYVLSVKTLVEGELKSINNNRAILATATGLSVLTMIITWLMGQPWYVQVAVGIIFVAIVALLAYYVYKSDDRRRAILEIIQLIRDILAIIEDIDPIVDKPVAAFTATPTSGDAPLTVQFSDQSTGKPTTFGWSFGDGTVSMDQNPSHIYVNAGVYSVKLTVANSQGENNLVRNNLITVNAKPTPDPVSEHAPGVEVYMLGNVPIAKLGGENRSKLKELLAGGYGWPGLTERVMDSTDANLDVLPNYPFAYWYDGSYGGEPGWMLSQQGYYYENNPITTRNTLHVIAHQKWLDGGAMVPYMDFTPLKEVIELKREGKKWVATVMHDGKVQRILLADPQRRT